MSGGGLHHSEDRGPASWDGGGTICIAAICRGTEWKDHQSSPVVTDTDVANLLHLTGEPSPSLNEEGGAPPERSTVKELQVAGWGGSRR